ncbi:MAG: GTP-binding protein [Eubacterium sp.]|nr:GTP-binding protein [Eubacterium sp.]
MTKVDVISGFLGAGKTTLIKELLSDALKGEQVVLIENEFGQIGIDGGFLKEAGIEIKEMNSGCICCSLVGDFSTALGEVVSQYHPDRIIIEPSGVGKLSDVIHAVENAGNDELVVNTATTVVDVTKCKLYLKNFGEFYENQVQTAGTVILSRTDTDRATPELVEEVLAMLRPLNEDATFITTPVADLGGKKVLETMEGVKIDLTRIPEEHHHHHHDHDHEHDHHDHDHEHHDHEHDHHDHDHEHHDHDHEHHDHDHDHEHHDHDHGPDCTCGCHDHDHDHDHHDHGPDCTCGCHDHDHDADEVFTSWGKETIRKYTQDEITEILTALEDADTYGSVLRAKGMVPAKDGSWIYFDMVPGEIDVRGGAPEYTGRLCVIGAEMNEDKLSELFHLV